MKPVSSSVYRMPSVLHIPGKVRAVVNIDDSSIALEIRVVWSLKVAIRFAQAMSNAFAQYSQEEELLAASQTFV